MKRNDINGSANVEGISLRRHFCAFALTVPAAAAALMLQIEVPFATMLFEGGRRVFLANVSQAILFPYVGIFLLALGTLFLPGPADTEDGRLGDLDIQLIRFFGGAAVMVILGFVLGLSGLLYSWITIPVFCGVLYAYFWRVPAVLHHVFAWIMARDGSARNSAGRDPFLQDVSAVLRIGGAAFVLFFLLASGILVNLYTSDAIQLYFPYLAEIRLRHSIWLDPAHPVYSDFLIGRGNGVHLFFATFTSQFFGQVISVVYFAAIPLTMQRAVLLVLSTPSNFPTWKTARAILPDCVMILVLLSPIFGIDTAKYHMQAGSFIIFLSWSGLLFLFTERQQAKWLFLMLVPVAIAIPIMLPQYQAVATISLAIAATAIYFARGTMLVRYSVMLILIGLIAMIGSLLFNQLYLGIAELSPASTFLKYSNPEKFRQWASPELFQYLSMTQNVKVFAVSFPEIPQLFSHWSSLVSNPKLRPILIGPVYVAVFAYLIFFFLTRIFSRARSARVLKLVGPKACIFIGAFLLNYIVAWTILNVTYLPSAGRLLQFQYAYLPVAQIAAIIFFVAFLPHGDEPTAESATLKRRTVLLLALASIVSSFMLVQSAIFIHELPLSYNIAIGLVLFVMVVRRMSKWPESPIIASIFGMASKIRVKWCSAVYGPIFFVFIAGITTYVGIGRFYYIYHANLSEAVGSPVHARAARYFFGKEGLIKSIRKGGFDFNRCIEIGQAVSGDARVLPLNANYNIVPCHNSPLLPRNKIVHHYESILAPYFEDVTFGDPEHAEETFRKLGINYFYIQLADTDFFGPGFGEIFSFDNLRQRFDVYRETPDFVILTWRGQGAAQVSLETAAYIEWLRAEGCSAPDNPLIDNCAGFFQLKNWREQQGK